VRPLVELLSLNGQRVFWDDNLKPGDRWDDVIRSSVKRSNIFVLFWCCDTRESEYVGAEIALALRLKKKIVPVKLCQAAMPDPLGKWQWIDLHPGVQHVCIAPHQVAMSEDLPVPRSLPAPGSKKFVGLGIAAALTLFLLVMFTPLLRLRPKPPGVSSPAKVDSSLPTSGATRLPNGWAVVQPPAGEGKGGWIIEFSRTGERLHTFKIPPGLTLSTEPDFQQVSLPWWYRNRGVLWLTFAFAAAVRICAWYLATRRRRSAETLSITVDYLHRLIRNI
jgi:TIR domain